MGTSETRNWRFTRRILSGVTAVGLAIPLLTAAPAQAVESSEHLLSVFGDDLAAVSQEVEASGGEVLATYDVADALLVELPNGTKPPQGSVSVPDSPMEFQSTETASDAAPTNTFRDTLKVMPEHNGSGVTVALIDTGVADTGEVAVQHVNVSGGPQGDGLGHGTFMAGLIAGNGAASDGAYQGVAPGAQVLDVQVALPDGSTSMSKVLAGLQAVADAQAADPSVRVVNLALNTGSPLPPWVDPLTRGLETLWAKGMTVVVASGNDGPEEISSPASDPTLLAVGAVAENKTPARGDDTLADFSSYGKVFGQMRPDLSAPGVSLVSLRAPGSIAEDENPDSHVGAKYLKGTGTSMSAAVASGATASLLSKKANLDPNGVKQLFMGTAYAGNLAAGAGAGGLDLEAALTTPLAQTPPLPVMAGNGSYGPAEEDAATWALFAQAWADGNLRGVVEAWKQLSPQTRRWAATAWSLAVLARSLTMPEDDFEGRRWGGRRWGTQEWNGRRWGSDNWVGRRWGSINWDAAQWAPNTWDKIDWEGRRWGSQDWLAFAWTARNIAADPRIGDSWVVDGEQWDGRRWGGQNWNGRRWGTTDWAGRRWGEEAWAGRRWADFVFTGRRWGGDNWEGRRWGTTEWIGRRWGGRRWGNDGWTGRRWGSDEWDGRRWGGRRWGSGEWTKAAWDAMSFEGRRWATDDWSGRRWG